MTVSEIKNLRNVKLQKRSSVIAQVARLALKNEFPLKKTQNTENFRFHS